MKIIKKRAATIKSPPKRSAFSWGPRKTRETYSINKNFSDSVLIDLLKTDVFADLKHYGRGNLVCKTQKTLT
jgi:hypothetical protein